MADIIYDKFIQRVKQGEIDLEADVIKIALLKNTHTPDQTDDDFADVSGDENPAGSGYTAGGETLANVLVTEEGGGVIKVDADDPLWTALTATNLRYAVIYDDTQANDALIYLFDFGSDKNPTAENFTIQFDSTGIFTAQQGT